MTETRPQTDDLLEPYFKAARAARPVPDETLMARVIGDGQRLQPAPEPAVLPDPGWLGQIRAALGGWGGLSGLATACATGIWLGFAPPAEWPDPVELMVSELTGLEIYESEDLAFNLIAGEG